MHNGVHRPMMTSIFSRLLKGTHMTRSRVTFVSFSYVIWAMSHCYWVVFCHKFFFNNTSIQPAFQYGSAYKQMLQLLTWDASKTLLSYTVYLDNDKIWSMTKKNSKKFGVLEPESASLYNFLTKKVVKFNNLRPYSGVWVFVRINAGEIPW